MTYLNLELFFFPEASIGHVVRDKKFQMLPANGHFAARRNHCKQIQRQRQQWAESTERTMKPVLWHETLPCCLAEEQYRLDSFLCAVTECQLRFVSLFIISIGGISHPALGEIEQTIIGIQTAGFSPQTEEGWQLKTRCKKRCMAFWDKLNCTLIETKKQVTKNMDKKFALQTCFSSVNFASWIKYSKHSKSNIYIKHEQ